jgi:hypothetical protein
VERGETNIGRAGWDRDSIRGSGDAVGQAYIPPSLALVHTKQDAGGITEKLKLAKLKAEMERRTGGQRAGGEE